MACITFKNCRLVRVVMRGIVGIIVFLLAVGSASAFVTVDHWWVPSQAFADGFVDTFVELDLEELPSDTEIKTTFVIPALGSYASKGFYDPVELRSTSIQRTLLVPGDADAGQYVIRMITIDEDGNRHVRHRFFDVE